MRRQVASNRNEDVPALVGVAPHGELPDSRFQHLISMVTWAPSSLHSEVESWVAATPIVTVFLGSVERRFSVPAYICHVAARSLGQAWPQATGEAGAQRA